MAFLSWVAVSYFVLTFIVLRFFSNSAHRPQISCAFPLAFPSFRVIDDTGDSRRYRKAAQGGAVSFGANLLGTFAITTSILRAAGLALRVPPKPFFCFFWRKTTFGRERMSLAQYYRENVVAAGCHAKERSRDATQIKDLAARGSYLCGLEKCYGNEERDRTE